MPQKKSKRSVTTPLFTKADVRKAGKLSNKELLFNTSETSSTGLTPTWTVTVSEPVERLPSQHTGEYPDNPQSALAKSWKSLKDFVRWTFVGVIITYILKWCVEIMLDNPRPVAYILVGIAFISIPIIVGRIARFIWYDHLKNIGFRIATWRNAYNQSKKNKGKLK